MVIFTTQRPSCSYTYNYTSNKNDLVLEGERNNATQIIQPLFWSFLSQKIIELSNRLILECWGLLHFKKDIEVKNSRSLLCENILNNTEDFWSLKKIYIARSQNYVDLSKNANL